jgi:hypothetical protein
MKKILMLALTGLSVLGLVGCGSSGSSTVLMGTLTGDTGTLSGVAFKAVNSSESFSETLDIDSNGKFSVSKVPAGRATLTLQKSGVTDPLTFDVDVDDKKTTEVEVFLMTWDPQAVAEYRVRSGDAKDFGSTRPLGPTGTTLSTVTDGSRVYTTLKGLVVTKKPDGSVVVDKTGYNP